jgi:hypothetical protein
MPYLYVRQRVKDFDTWYSVFQSHTEAAEKAGLTDLQLLRDVSDENVIVCLFRIEDLARARAFTETPEASEAKTDSGIIGEPEVLWLEEL